MMAPGEPPRRTALLATEGGTSRRDCARAPGREVFSQQFQGRQKPHPAEPPRLPWGRLPGKLAAFKASVTRSGGPWSGQVHVDSGQGQ